MDIATFEAEADAEATHWWFAGRRTLFARELKRLGVSRTDRILDVGTSTGTNLRMLKERNYPNVVGLDLSPVAIEYCARKGLGQVELGDVCAIPHDDESFDMVLATDVIEHVDDDRKAVSEIFRVTAPGGYALITVPAFHALWGLQDRVAHHKRRYLRRPLIQLIAASGFTVEHSYYFNYLLFVPIWLARKIIRVLPVDLESENQVNNPLINGVLGGVFTLDIATAPVLRPPFGVSILAVAKKPMR